MGKDKKPEVVPAKVNKKATPEIAKTKYVPGVKYVVAPNGKRVPVGG